MPLPTAIIPLIPFAKHYLARVLTHKLAPETDQDAYVRAANGTRPPLEFRKVKAGASGSLALSIALSVLTYFSSTGAIDPILFEMIKELLALILAAPAESLPGVNSN